MLSVSRPSPPRRPPRLVRPDPFFACSLPRSLGVVIGGLELVKGLVDLTLEIFPGVSRSRPEFPDFLFEVIGLLVQIFHRCIYSGPGLFGRGGRFLLIGRDFLFEFRQLLGGLLLLLLPLLPHAFFTSLFFLGKTGFFISFLEALISLV